MLLRRQDDHHNHPQVTLLCCLVAVAVAKPNYLTTEPPAHSYEYKPPAHSYEYKPPAHSYEQKPEMGMPFDFEYAVQDHYNGLDFGHNSNSDGKVESGRYYVLLPDGRTQTVTYTADANGYRAEVVYEGEAKYPEPQQYEPDHSYLPPVQKPTSLYGAPN